MPLYVVFACGIMLLCVMSSMLTHCRQFVSVVSSMLTRCRQFVAVVSSMLTRVRQFVSVVSSMLTRCRQFACLIEPGLIISGDYKLVMVHIVYSLGMHCKRHIALVSLCENKEMSCR